MKLYLGYYDKLSYSTILDMNFWLDSVMSNNKKKYSLENGKLYLEDKTKNNKWKDRNEIRK